MLKQQTSGPKQLKFFMKVDLICVSSSPIHSRQTSAERTKQFTRCWGVSWCVATDELLPIIGFHPTVKCWSKREVASVLASIYDPLELAVPVITPVKCFLQDLWKLRMSWDAPLDEDHQRQFSKTWSTRR